MAETSLNGSGCCGETEATNPKRDLFRKRSHAATMHLYKLRNPIPDEVEDSEELRSFFKRWNFVPYAGSIRESGHSLLIWYMTLYKLSPTHNACITKKIRYALGSKVFFKPIKDPEFEIVSEEESDLSPQAQKAYRDDIKEFFEFQDGIGKFHRRLGVDLEITGNAYVEMSYAETLGVRRVHLKVHKPLHCLYVNTPPGQMRVMAISPIWTEDYLQKHEPRYLPVSRLGSMVLASDENGVQRTIFHLKTGDNDWYGRPESQGSDLYKYREFQDALYQIKEAGSNYTGRTIIETEDANPQYEQAMDDEAAQAVGFENHWDRFRENFTQDGEDPQSVMVASRPFGSRPMFVFQLKPNTNENWYKVTGEISEDKIVRSHGLTRGFMGFQVSRGFAQDSEITDYVMNNAKTIDDTRDIITNFTNGIITEGWNLVGKPENGAKVSIDFVNPIQSVVDSFTASKQAALQINSDPNDPNQGGNNVQKNEPDNGI